MDNDTEGEELLESLAKALNWQPVELEALAGLGCHLFEWKPQDRERQLAQLEDGG